jgi:hypothetical protein
VYPGDLLCILVTPVWACQGVVPGIGGFRQPGTASACQHGLARSLLYSPPPCRALARREGCQVRDD